MAWECGCAEAPGGWAVVRSACVWGARCSSTRRRAVCSRFQAGQARPRASPTCTTRSVVFSSSCSTSGRAVPRSPPRP